MARKSFLGYQFVLLHWIFSICNLHMLYILKDNVSWYNLCLNIFCWQYVHVSWQTIKMSFCTQAKYFWCFMQVQKAKYDSQYCKYDTSSLLDSTLIRQPLLATCLCCIWNIQVLIIKTHLCAIWSNIDVFYIW